MNSKNIPQEVLLAADTIHLWFCIDQDCPYGTEEILVDKWNQPHHKFWLRLTSRLFTMLNIKLENIPQILREFLKLVRESETKIDEATTLLYFYLMVKQRVTSLEELISLEEEEYYG